MQLLQKEGVQLRRDLRRLVGTRRCRQLSAQTERDSTRRCGRAFGWSFAPHVASHRPISLASRSVQEPSASGLVGGIDEGTTIGAPATVVGG